MNVPLKDNAEKKNPKNAVPSCLPLSQNRTKSKTECKVNAVADDTGNLIPLFC